MLPPQTNLATILRAFAGALEIAYSVAEARVLARRVLGHRLGLAPHELALRGADALSATTLTQLTDDQRRLLAHEPVQYVLGEAPFLELELEVGPGVLIPRPETEELVQLITVELRDARAPRLLDVGTGSGCIAVAVAQILPRAEVWGLDISDTALAIARRNGARYGNRVTWLQHDVFQPLTPEIFDDQLDGLISNPPYVPQREAAEMAPHVRDHEPALALFVPDDDPLRYYRRLAEVGSTMLRPKGRIYLETHTEYAAAVADLLRATGYAAVTAHNDFTDRPRFVTGTRVA